VWAAKAEKEKKKDVTGEKKKKNNKEIISDREEEKEEKGQTRQRLSVKNPKNSLFICVPARLLISAGVDRN
jgi:hypothetical protein